MTTISSVAYTKTCGGCGSEIFMAICRDGRWRPFELKRQAVPVPFAWAWRKRVGMEETDTVCGHFIHYCADYHDRAFQFAGNTIYEQTRRDARGGGIAAPEEESA